MGLDAALVQHSKQIIIPVVIDIVNKIQIPDILIGTDGGLDNAKFHLTNLDYNQV